MNNDLIFGKDTTQKVVGLEINDDQAEVFVQDDHGTVTSVFKSNKFWLLASEPIEGCIRLKGDQHYKYALQFTERRQFLKARSVLKHQYDIYSIYDPQEAFQVRYGLTFFKNLRIDEVSVLSFDIETNGLTKDDNSRVYYISNTFRDSKGNITKKLFCFDDYNNDGEMIEDWCRFVRQCNPSIVTGFNQVMFDLPFLYHVAELHGVGLNLGRDGSNIRFNNYESELRKDATQKYSYYKCYIYGRSIVDVFFLAVKTDNVAKKWMSLGLKTIIKEEGLENPNRTFYDAASIRKNIDNPAEREKIKKYVIDDSDDALNLLDKLFPPYYYSARSISKTMQGIVESASGSQINSIMVRSYLQEGCGIPKTSEVTYFKGAISFGVPGIYRNACRFDFSSMYPSIIMSYKIYDKYKDPNGNLLNLTEYFTRERLVNKENFKKTKNIYFQHLEQSEKIFINSIYGFMGSQGLNFNFPVGAAEVTRKGRQLLEHCIKWASGKQLKDFTDV